MTIRPHLFLVALLLGCATAEPAKEVAPLPDTVPVAMVNEAIAKLAAEGLELVQQRDEAIDLAKKYRLELHECDAGRRT